MSSHRGRHRAPAGGHGVVRVATVASALAVPLVNVSTASAASPPGVAEAVRACESGDRNIENGGDAGGTSTASGFYQFVNGSWRFYGGTEFASRAIGASKAEQTVVFERAFAANGLVDWDASRPCWSKKIVDAPRHSSGEEAPRHAASTAPRHAAPERLADDDGTYVVRRGDTLGEIAVAHHTTARKIFDANRDVVGEIDLIFPGERLHV